MQSGDAGDFWCIQENIEVPEMETRRPRKPGEKWGGAEGDARRILNLTDGSEKPLGEWNAMEITCQGNEVIVKVNGDLVNHATNCNVTRGAICLQSEGAPIHYRNVKLTPLASQ